MADALYPCTPWPIDPVCCPDWPQNPEEWDDAHREAQMLATIELWRAVGGIIGLCRTFERPCLDDCNATVSTWTGWMSPYVRDGNWYNNGGCGCTGDCSCSRLCTVTLQGPVYQIERVRIGGETLPESAWRVITGDRLARVDGGCWPTCQDLGVPDEDGFLVEYLRGIPPGPDAVRAVSLLACRKLADCPPGTAGCGQLPSGVTQITREGISARFDGDGDNEFRSGVRFTDEWVASVNPFGLTERPSVWSPDVPEPLVFYEGPVM
jgi:hypothetical protein